MSRNPAATPRWPRPFLLIAGSAELLLELTAAVLSLLLGGHGFAAGEMGTMIGIFSAALLLVLLPYLAARAAAVYGLWKRRRWAAVLTIVLSAVVLLATAFIIGIAPLVYAVILLYGLLSGWAALLCLRSSTFTSRRTAQ